jgi:putative ABC transport system permease protein
MSIINTLKVSYRALGRNKLRSFLTMLGIIIGVGAVIAMLAIGQGARFIVESQIQSLGTNVLVIAPGAAQQAGVHMDAGTMVTLTEDDARAMRDECPAIAYITPVARTFGHLVSGNTNWHTSVWGVYPEYLQIRDWRLSAGSVFGETDLRAAAKVCLIGQTIVNNLYADTDPIGKTLRLRNMPFRVIGVLDRKGQSAMGQDQDDIIIAPYSTIEKKMMGSHWSSSALASAINKTAMDEAQKQITEVLRARHRLMPWQENDFTVRSQSDIAAAADTTSKTLTVLLASIASISLIVGGIGIMNIMLVSVTERTREIGIRMSVGARSRDVLCQFLIEAVVMSISGGLIGVLLGVISSRVISSWQNWPIFISLEAVVLAFVFSGAVGIFFGFYPARKAALLNPIEALRYE